MSVRTPVRGSARREVVGAGLAALLLAAGAVGCSKGGSQESPEMTPAAAVAKAATHADDITSAHYRMAGQVPGEGRIKGDAEMRVKPTIAMSMRMTVAVQGTDRTVEIRLVDKAMYLNGGAEAAKETGGKSWLKFDLSKSSAGKDLDQLGSAQADQNPASQSTFLTGAKDVRKVGSETVDGVKTTHYQGTATVDELRKALKRQDKGKDERIQQQHQKSLAQYDKMGVDALTMDMWIDGRSHTKQFRLRGDAVKGPLDLTITFLDYNQPVKVAAPPAADTADLSALMKESGRG